MQRRLREQGETFRAVLNRTREALVRHYLKRPEITAEISFLLSKGRRAVLLLTDCFAAAAQVGVPANEAQPYTLRGEPSCDHVP